jgi:hypothetical protein
LQVAGTGDPAAINTVRYDNTQYANAVNIAKSRGTSVGANSIVQNNDVIGQINFAGADGTAFIPAADISAEVDGTPGSNDMPGRLVFSTTADGASTPTERLRIASTGAFGLSGANYGTSGQVLTSQGSGSSPQWATPGGAYTAQSSINPNTAAVSWTSLPSGIQVIETGWMSGYHSLHSSSSDRPLVQVQDGGTWKTSNYLNYGWNCSPSSTPTLGFNGNIGGINPYFWINNTYRETVTIKINRAGSGNNAWSFSLSGISYPTGGGNTYKTWSDGTFNLTNELTGIRVQTFNGTGTLNGTFFLNYAMRA